MKRFLKIGSYFLVALLAAGIALVMAGRNNASYPKLAELKEVINEYFVDIDEVDHAAVEDAAAAAIVEALGDRWSYYMTAAEYQTYLERMNNAYVGIGITITQREDGYITVIRVEPGGPAEEAGIQAGDVITTAAGQDIAALDIDRIKDLIRGEQGTTVKLRLLRDNAALEFEVERRTVQRQVAAGKLLNDEIGLVTIMNFDGRCAEETLSQVEQLLAQGAKALIFDVRFNPGGYKHELIEILDEGNL